MIILVFGNHFHCPNNKIAEFTVDYCWLLPYSVDLFCSSSGWLLVIARFVR